LDYSTAQYSLMSHVMSCHCLKPAKPLPKAPVPAHALAPYARNGAATGRHCGSAGRGCLSALASASADRGPAAADTQHMSLWANRCGAPRCAGPPAPGATGPRVRDRLAAAVEEKKSHWHAGLEQCRCVPRGPPAIRRTGVVAGLAATYSGSHSFTGHWDIRTSRMVVMHGTVN